MENKIFGHLNKEDGPEKTAASGDAVPATKSSDDDDKKKIWITPTNWKTMGSEKQSVVVDIWHRDNSYSDDFPWNDMAPGGDGITFSVSNLKEKTALRILQKGKIPHKRATYEQIEKGRTKASNALAKAES